ncbi:contact-dependent growth inhibition system immunity protein [Paenibacillus sp. FSL R7-0273]|uniref:contact-dependent growth inhibition system immunity protein n=1 Tax=Paenibacillus sp. FSL R7-0273 TaxID=1536772 RepID=UPI001E407D02|nr:contact-dependent growth inhibition system immunity protein [Paenibacillus sp. FSL R7-0273]
MINRKMTLKEFLTNEEYESVMQNATQYSDMSLPVWHLEITGKCLYELSNFDLIRCIRQDVFKDLATFEIIERIDEQNTPFYADIDSMELMEKLSSISSEMLSAHKSKLDRMIENLEKNNLIDLADVWMFDEQKETYQGYINIIQNKIK